MNRRNLLFIVVLLGKLPAVLILAILVACQAMFLSSLTVMLFELLLLRLV